MTRGAPAFPVASMACPFCSAAMAETLGAIRCEGCGETYPRPPESGQGDLRLRREKRAALTHPVGARPPLPDGVVVERLAPDPDTEIRGWAELELDPDLAYGNRLSPEFVSYFPHAREAGEWMLDLGCGQRNFEPLCRELTGFGYVGVDHVGTAPDLLVDAHALPFTDATFRFVLSVAVLEHLAQPDVAMREVFRVLRPGGVFAGTVAFLEPFHMDSYFHMTHLGLHRVLADAGFAVVAIAPNKEWSGPRAQAEMSLFPGLPRAVRRSLQAPATFLSRTLWTAKQMNDAKKTTEKRDRVLETTGGFRFVARRA